MFMAGLMAQRTIPVAGLSIVGSEKAHYVGTGNFTCAVPAGAASGDLLICLLAAPQLGNNNMVCNTSGFTEIYDEYVEASDNFFGVNIGIYYQLLSGSPPASVSFKGITIQAENHAQVIAIRGANTSTPISATINDRTSASSPPTSPASNTASHPANAMMLLVHTMAAFYGSGTVNGSVGISGGPTILQSRQSNYSGRVGGLTSAYLIKEAAGGFSNLEASSYPFTDVYNTGGTSDCGINVTLAINPA